MHGESSHPSDREFSFPFPRQLALEPSAQLEELRTTQPVAMVRLPSGDKAWLVSGYDDVREVLADRRFSCAAASEPGAPEFVPFVKLCKSLFSLDPPILNHIRRLLARSLTRRHIASFRPRIIDIAERVVDELVKQSPPADFVVHLSTPFSKQVMAALLGISDPVLEELTWHYDSLITVHSAPEAEIMAGWAKFRMLVLDLLAEKRKRPSGDLLTRLVAKHAAQRVVSEEHLVGLVVTLLAAGIGTPIVQVNNGLANLLRYEDQMTLIRRSPALIDRAVEEILRYNTPVEVEHLRITTAEVTIAGVTIPADSPVLTSIASANRDERCFVDPATFDITRVDNPHLAFGYGPHVCLGADLARVQLAAAFSTILARLPGLRLAVPATKLRPKNRGLHSVGIRELPVIW